ncbi:MAG: polyhydroxyalkanoate synthesis repressor PhaR [Alphaproteobacteria bacterium]|nr:polyhydroxyalkanoate synthesis repressor PhaR [Alphaproteobacteria bacterium]
MPETSARQRRETPETSQIKRKDVSEESSKGEAPVVIKKYANRRLYNTQTSSYVTLDHLAQMVKDGTEFEVRDARTGEDITRSVLTQIIFEEEAKGQSLLPIKFLRQLIRFYGDSLQSFVPGYLDMSMDGFAKNQEQMRNRLAEAFGGSGQVIENLTRQNMAMFERAMQMFSPFGQPTTRRATSGDDETKGNGTASSSAKPSEEISELKSEIEAMRKQLAELSQRK